MKKIVSLLLVLALLIALSPTRAFAEGAQSEPPVGMDGQAGENGENGENGEKVDVGFIVLISLFPLAAIVVGVFWAIRFKEKHIDGK